MLTIKRLKDELAGKTKQLVGEIIGDQKLHDEGRAEEKAREREGHEDVDKPSKPLGNLDQLT